MCLSLKKQTEDAAYHPVECKVFRTGQYIVIVMMNQMHTCHDFILKKAFMRLFALVLVCSGLFPACAPDPRFEPGNIFWPMPPDPPRIKYVQSIYNEDDIGRVYSLKEKLFGKEYNDTMSRPYGVSARHNKIIVTDVAVRSVLVFNTENKRLSFIGSERAIRNPSSAVTDVSGMIYVADAGVGKIAVYSPKGEYKTSIFLNDSKIVSLAINESFGRLYALDRAKHRVIVCSLEGQQLFTFGSQGDENGQFNIPLSIAVDKQGTVYVLDNGNFRVQIFDPDGKFVSKFGEVGDGPGLFANPKGIAVDSDRHIYVTDAAFSNFQIFDQNGNVLMYIGSLGPSPGQLHLPAGISIDENDRIYVADQFNKRIQVFQYFKDTH